MTDARALRMLAVAFSIFQISRGMLWLSQPPASPWMYASGIALYALVVAAALFARDRRAGDRTRVPMWVGLLAAVAGALLPTTTVVGLAPVGAGDRAYGLWYLGGMGVVAVVLVVRGAPRWGWLALATLSASAMVWLTPLGALSRGLVGSALWVGVAHLAMRLVQRSSRDAERLEHMQSRSAAVEAVQEGRERERRIQLQRALAIGGPILERIIGVHGALTEGERHAASIAEARLRDELRGPHLLDDEVRASIDAARARGTLVSVFDEGGLDALDDQELAVVRSELAHTVRASSSRRLFVRTSPHDRVAVTVVGRGESDDDVDLWHEIERPGHRSGKR